MRAPTEGRPCAHKHTAECYTVLSDGAYAVAEDTENLLGCRHVHDEFCGYAEPDPGAPCGYVCRVCPVQNLIAALPQHVTEDNRDAVTAQLQEILPLYAALDEAEQEQIDITPCLLLQEELDGASQPDLLATDYNVSAGNVTITSSGNYTVTGTTTSNHITVNRNVTVNLTIKGLSIRLPYNDGSNSALMHAGIELQNGASLNLTLEGTNTITGGTVTAAAGGGLPVLPATVVPALRQNRPRHSYHAQGGARGIPSAAA